MGAKPSVQPPQLPTLDPYQLPSDRGAGNSTGRPNGTEYDEEEAVRRAKLESSEMASRMATLPDFLDDASDLMDLQEFSDIPPTLVSYLPEFILLRSVINYFVKSRPQLILLCFQTVQIRFAIVEVSLPIPHAAQPSMLDDGFGSTPTDEYVTQDISPAANGWDLAYCVANLGTVTRIIESPVPYECGPVASAAVAAAAAACRLFRAAPAASFPMHEADEISVLGQVSHTPHLCCRLPAHSDW